METIKHPNESSALLTPNPLTSEKELTQEELDDKYLITPEGIETILTPEEAEKERKELAVKIEKIERLQDLIDFINKDYNSKKVTGELEKKFIAKYHSTKEGIAGGIWITLGLTLLSKKFTNQIKELKEAVTKKGLLEKLEGKEFLIRM